MKIMKIESRKNEGLQCYILQEERIDAHIGELKRIYPAHDRARRVKYYCPVESVRLLIVPVWVHCYRVIKCSRQLRQTCLACANNKYYQCLS